MSKHGPELGEVFCMETYLVDCVCVGITFPPLGWKCGINYPPIHSYLSIMWDDKYKFDFIEICDGFKTPLYMLIFNKLALRLLEEAHKAIQPIRDWYMVENCTFLKIFGVNMVPQLLTKFVLDKVS
jgi:hypothetical protein